jgi:RNase P/RNase MRP subunit p29
MASGGTRTAFVILGALLATAMASGDEVLLVGGGKITGTIVEKTKDVVVIEAAAGQISVPMRRVLRIVDPDSGAEAYRARAAALGPRDVDGWAALARWAAEQDLLAESRAAWKKVLVLDPFHPEAKAAVGHADPDRTWKATEEEYRAQGYEQFEGRWVTRDERRALERERAAEEARDQQVRQANEAEARTREAEARARTAEPGSPPSDDAGVTPARPSDVLPPSSGPRPTEVYISHTPPRPEPTPRPAPAGIAPTQPAPKAQGSSSGGGSQKPPK